MVTSDRSCIEMMMMMMINLTIHKFLSVSFQWYLPMEEMETLDLLRFTGFTERP